MAEQLKLFSLELLFDADVVERANLLLKRFGSDAAVVAGVRSSDDLFSEEESSWWRKISLACRYVSDGLCTPVK